MFDKKILYTMLNVLGYVGGCSVFVSIVNWSLQVWYFKCVNCLWFLWSNVYQWMGMCNFVGRLVLL